MTHPPHTYQNKRTDRAGYNNADNDMTKDRVFRCICGTDDEGEWICCDSPTCEVIWFHFGCVGLLEVPVGDWLCPSCRPTKRQNPFATPGQKKGVAIKKTVSKPKPKPRWIGWQELSAEEEEKFRQEVEGPWIPRVLQKQTRAKTATEPRRRKNAMWGMREKEIGEEVLKAAEIEGALGRPLPMMDVDAEDAYGEEDAQPEPQPDLVPDPETDGSSSQGPTDSGPSPAIAMKEEDHRAAVQSASVAPIAHTPTNSSTERLTHEEAAEVLLSVFTTPRMASRPS